MGAWAIDAFGNDDACDWAFALEETNDLSLIDDTLSGVLSVGAEYLEAPMASEALAAAEVLARLQGNKGDESSDNETVDNWISENKLKSNADLNKKAHAVIDRILSKDSELCELWEESDDAEAWKASVLGLKSRIKV